MKKPTQMVLFRGLDFVKFFAPGSVVYNYDEGVLVQLKGQHHKTAPSSLIYYKLDSPEVLNFPIYKEYTGVLNTNPYWSVYFPELMDVDSSGVVCFPSNSGSSALLYLTDGSCYDISPITGSSRTVCGDFQFVAIKKIPGGLTVYFYDFKKSVAYAVTYNDKIFQTPYTYMGTAYHSGRFFIFLVLNEDRGFSYFYQNMLGIIVFDPESKSSNLLRYHDSTIYYSGSSFLSTACGVWFWSRIYRLLHTFDPVSFDLVSYYRSKTEFDKFRKCPPIDMVLDIEGLPFALRGTKTFKFFAFHCINKNSPNLSSRKGHFLIDLENRRVSYRVPSQVYPLGVFVLDPNFHCCKLHSAKTKRIGCTSIDDVASTVETFDLVARRIG